MEDIENVDEDYNETISNTKPVGHSFLKFRTIDDKTKKDVEIPKKDVRLSPIYIRYEKSKHYSNEEPIEPWYEVKSDRIATDKYYSQHWYIARNQIYVNSLILKQKKYIQSLSDEQKDTLIGYTFIGDTIINNFMRNRYYILSGQIYRIFTAIERGEYPKLPLDWQIYHFFEYITKSGVKTSYKKADLIIKKELQREKIHAIFADNVDWFSNPRNIEPLVTDIILKTINIILKAPRSPYPIKVYRGITSEHINSLNFISSDFWSTSYIPNSALRFTGLGGYSTYWCIYEITIKPGVPCLYISDLSKYSSEFEILLPPFIQYRTSDRIDIKGLYTQQEYEIDPLDKKKFKSAHNNNAKIPNRFNNDYYNLFGTANNFLNESEEYIPYKVATITVIADKFSQKGLQYLERKRHWRNVKEEADIDEYLAKVARKEKYDLIGVPIDDESLVPTSSKRTIRKKIKSIRTSTKRNSFKKQLREEERRKTRKLKRSHHKLNISTNNTN